MGKKLNVIFDANNHYHKCLHAANMFSKGRILDTKRDQDMYMRKIATDFAFIMRMIGVPDRVVFAMDSFSWRKEVDMLQQVDSYKGNRVRDDSAVNWDAFNTINRDFFDILSNQGFISSTLPGAEGDDLMYFWSKKFYEDGEDVIICSGDGDMTQLVKFSDKNFVCVFNTKSTTRQVIGAPGFGDWIRKKVSEPKDAFDIFMSSDFIQSPIETIAALIDQTKLIETDPNTVIYDKIVCGDGGDNIPPVINWQTTQSGGKVINNKITPIKAAIIKEMVLNKGNGCDITNLQQYAEIFRKGIKQIYDKDIDTETLRNRLERNTRLVYLSHETIPIQIQNQFELHYTNFDGVGAPKLGKMTMQALLEGSQYNNGSIALEADIFANAAPTNIKASTKSLF